MELFEFAYPERLIYLVAVPALYLIYWGVVVVRRRRLARFGNRATLLELMPERSVARGWIKITLLALAAIFLCLAAARPRTGSKLRTVETTGREIMLVVDVSNSMLAEDIEPSRMERTRYAISRLVEGMKEDRVGLVAFAGEAEVLLPITSDYKMAESKVRSLSPSIISNQGTDIGAALELATLSFTASSHDKNNRVVVLITDGEAHDEGALATAEVANKEGITICAIGIGTPEGETLKIGGRYIEDESGNMVVTKLNEELLQQVAAATEGIYTRSRNDDFGLEGIIHKLDEIEAEEFTERIFDEYEEQYQWFLGVAIVLLAIEALVLTRRNPLLRGVKLFDGE